MTPGTFVQIICHDGAQFAGWVDTRTDQYVVLSGRGFPLEDIRLVLDA